MNRLVILLAAALPVAAVAPAVGGPRNAQDPHDESAECRLCVEDCVDTAQRCRDTADARFEECREPCLLEPDAETGADCYRACRRTQRAENEVCDRGEASCIGDCHPNPEPRARQPALAEADRTGPIR